MPADTPETKVEVVNRSRRAFLGFLAVGLTATVLGAYSGKKADEPLKGDDKNFHGHRKNCDGESSEIEQELKKTKKGNRKNAKSPDAPCDKADNRIIKNLIQATSGEKIKSLARKGLRESTHTLASYVRTTVESIIEYFVSSGSARLISSYDLKKYREAFSDTSVAPSFEDYQIKTGNRSMIGVEDWLGRYIKNPKILNGFMRLGAVVGAPLAEEYLARLAVAEIYAPRADKGYAWDVGIPTAFVFGLAHNLRGFADDGGMGIRFDSSIPMQQTVLGFYTWYAMKRPDGGYTHSVLAHAIHNALCNR